MRSAVGDKSMRCSNPGRGMVIRGDGRVREDETELYGMGFVVITRALD